MTRLLAVPISLLALAISCRSPASDNSELYAAIARGDVAAVRALLDAGADPSSSEVKQGFAERAARPTSQRPPPPLVFAIVEKRPECALVLLERGARADARDDAGFTALEHAASLGQAAVVGTILEHGGDASGTSKHGFPLIFVPAGLGHAEVARALLAKGADASARDTSGEAARHYVGSLDSVYEKLRGRSGPRVRPGATPMMLAAQRGSADVVRAFLDAGADVNARDDAGRTALMLVAEEGIGRETSERFGAVARVLLERGVDVAATDRNGDTALARAHQLAGLSPTHAELAKLIEARGAKR